MRIESLSKYLEFVEKVSTQNVLFRGQHYENGLRPGLFRTFPEYSVEQMLDLEDSLLNKLKIDGATKLTREYDSSWYLLSEAQHFGLKTRLLDWTTNPLVALWFSCHGAKGIGSTYVFAFNFKEDQIADLTSNPFETKGIKVFQPKIYHSRVEAQSGWFTIHEPKKMKSKEFVAIDNDPSLDITKVEISGLNRQSILNELDRCSINEKSIYPDLAGLCSHLNYLLIDKVRVRNEQLIDAKREYESLKYSSEYYSNSKKHI
ncbi:FRG domain-containing protein [Vibrio vulnificus]|uniref:FRG domain-containing protein n=1 Tax=Vibrio vulnificus TaxID=672 RepID=UPI001CDC000E|nr:FRG domain-containing protein [Vibrio vulnificus]MCA3912699.1 FRG domain-containing protein [Vibrio vulnificus]